MGFWTRKYSVQIYWDRKYNVRSYRDRRRLRANYYCLYRAYKKTTYPPQALLLPRLGRENAQLRIKPVGVDLRHCEGERQVPSQPIAHEPSILSLL